MIDVVSLENAHLFGPALASQHRLRYRVFVERQCWDVPRYNGMEYDQFDTPAAVYLIYRDRFGEARGISRLIPTTQPYMIKEIWADMVDRPDLPAEPAVWEATRFGIDYDLDPALRRRISAELVLACQEFGLAHGIRQYLVLMPALIIRKVIGGAGCRYQWLGEQRRVDKYRVAAASVEVSPQDLAAARNRLGIHQPVLNMPHTEKEAA